MKVIKFGVFMVVLVFMSLFAFVAGTGFGAYYVLSPVGGPSPVRIEISKGATAADIAKTMQKSHVIKNAFLFRILVKITKSDSSMKSGVYMINPNDNMMMILEQLKIGPGKLKLVTIPEGLTTSQIAEILENNGVVKSADFIRAAEKGGYEINGEKIGNLEGYLFPETYDFPDYFKVEDVIGAMVETFNREAASLYDLKKNRLPVKLSLYDVITLASLVERETQVQEEAPVVAMVYYNRLRAGMPLQCDATIQYILGKQKEVLTLDDLKINSPYNTYLHDGLPPGPIANPGINSIRAALNPEKVNYLYYVRNDVKNDGSHVFSRNYEEHKSAIRKYQK